MLSATVWAAPTMVYDAGAGNIIHGIAYYGGNMLLTFGTTKDITHVLYPDATSPAVLFAGERGYDIVSYQGYAIWADARASGFPNQLRMVTGTGIQFRWVDSNVKRVTTAQAEVTIATNAALYSYSGRVAEFTVPVNGGQPGEDHEVLRWTGDVQPFFQHGVSTDADDFSFIVGFGGRTYAWVGRMVLEHDPNGERAGWRDTGLGGVRCFGACVAAGYLVVSILTAQNTSELWAWDGSGWWIIDKQAWSGTNEYLRPIALAGAGGFDVGVFQRGTANLRLFRLVWRSAALHNYPTAATYTTSLIDADERDKAKAWRKIGAVFASLDLPGNPTSVDAVNVGLGYSIDNGASFVTPATAAPSGNTLAGNNFTLDANIASDAAVSRFLMLRVTWSSVSDWAPVLVGLWTEYETLDSPARRRRWQFTVQAEDQVIDRDGAQLTRTGRQQVGELWDHWQDGATIPFRDIDYDAAAVERRVRIVGIEEVVPVPHEAGKWGQSAVMLTLVEV